MDLLTVRKSRKFSKIGYGLLCCAHIGKSASASSLDEAHFYETATLSIQTQATGKIKNENNEVLVGTTIRNRTNKLSTASKVDGAFQIEAKQGTVLEFTSLGNVTQAVTYSGCPSNIVMLKNESALEEVVVTAIGIKEQKLNLDYAAQEDKTEVLDQSKTMNIENALSGHL